MRALGAAFVALWLVLGGAGWRRHVRPKDKPAATPEARSPVQSGLRWLARHQCGNGRWSATRFNEACPGTACTGGNVAEDDTSLTAIATLAFLEAGYTPQNRASYVDPCSGKTMKLGEAVRRAIDYLSSEQGASGAIGDVDASLERHALATVALSECYGLTNVATDRDRVSRAIAVIESARTPDGVWGRFPRDPVPDDIVTGICAMALKSAQISGIEIQGESVAAIRSWARTAATPAEPLGAVYRVLGEVYFREKGAPFTKANVDTLLGKTPRWEDRDFEGWYLDTIALFNVHPDDDWKKWKKAIMDLLAERQAKEGCEDGSWDGPCGRVRATARATLNLEIYERVSVFSSK